MMVSGKSLDEAPRLRNWKLPWDEERMIRGWARCFDSHRRFERKSAIGLRLPQAFMPPAFVIGFPPPSFIMPPP